MALDPADMDENTELEDLPTTDSGAVKKKHAAAWMQTLDDPDPDSAANAVIPKPSSHTGSTYATEISNVRVTGDPEFITEVAKFLTWFLDLEGINTRLEINLQRTEDRDSGELTDNYALYLSAAHRG